MKSCSQGTLSNVKHGIVCFTIDDRNFSEILPFLSLFEKYDARFTCFVSGPIDKAALEAIREFTAQGHAAGLHSVTHADVVPYFSEHGGTCYIENEVMPQLSQCMEAGIEVTSYAYPKNGTPPGPVYSDETDEVLGGIFRHLRHAGAKLQDGQRFCDCAAYFQPVAEISSQKVFHAMLIDMCYHRDQTELDAMIERAAEKNELIVFVLHGIIQEEPKDRAPMRTSVSRLEHMLKKAVGLGVQCRNFNMLP